MIFGLDFTTLALSAVAGVELLWLGVLTYVHWDLRRQYDRLMARITRLQKDVNANKRVRHTSPGMPKVGAGAGVATGTQVIARGTLPPVGRHAG